MQEGRAVTVDNLSHPREGLPGKFFPIPTLEVSKTIENGHFKRVALTLL
jgi:hypothetical protein